MVHRKYKTQMVNQDSEVFDNLLVVPFSRPVSRTNNISLDWMRKN